MNCQEIERFPSRLLEKAPGVKFDATNPDHRRSALNFLKFGRWDTKFEMEWPYTTVPQTVMMKLAEYACREEAPALFAEQGLQFTFGDPFNTHPYTPITAEDAKAGIRVHGKPNLQVVNG